MESTCCYGAGASCPWPPMHSCIPACPPSYPDPHGDGMESRAECWTGHSVTSMGTLHPALCLLLLQTGLEVTLNLATF